jgi:hypothetical protein
MKTLLRLIVVLLVLAAALYLGRNYIARQSVEAGVTKMTGFPLNIGSLDLDLFQNRIAVRDLSLLNPSEFKEPVFVEMPELTVDYDAGSMLSGIPHLTSLVLDLKRVVIVRTKTGDSNAMKLKGALGGGGGKVQYKIDALRLKIGTVELKDYKLGNPMEKTIPINLDETFKNFGSWRNSGEVKSTAAVG